MSTILSNRVQKVKPSATMAVSDKAKELKSQGIQIISMGSGEPDFDTPTNIQKAAIKAIGNGETRYTAADGTPELKKAICEKFKRENGLDYSLNEVMVSCGGKQVFYNLCQAVLNSGDEVIIPTPYWVSYPDMAILADATPVFIDTGLDQEFKITPEQLEASITSNTKLLVLNSPSNPTGSVYSKSEVEALGAVLEKYPHVLIISDDIYEHLVYDDFKFATMRAVAPDLAERTVSVNGVAKSYCMTGWRIGYCAGPVPLIKAMAKLQSQSTSCPNSIAQHAAIAALDGPTDFMVDNLAAFARRREMVVDALNAMKGITCLKPDGAFYRIIEVSLLGILP